MKYIVSPHARQRFVNRFKMQFHPSYFISNELTDSLIISLIRRSHQIMWWESVPFYLNKIYTKHGPTKAFKFQDKEITFLCRPIRNDAMLIRTVVKKFDPRY